MGLFDIFSNKDAQDAANARINGLQQGFDALSGNYGQARNAITTNYDAAAAPLQTVFDSSTGGANAYGDATGANGSAGYDRARSNFQTNPGYQFQFDQGLQAIDRGAASKGMVTSGNTLNAEQQYGTGLANQSYGGYVAGLQPYLGQQSGAASGIAGVRTGEGNALGTNFMQQGNAANATATGQGNAQAAADLNNYNISQNMWKGLGQVASLASGGITIPGMGMPGGSLTA